MTLHISLPPNLEESVRRRVETGHYGSASEVVREALRLMEERDRERHDRLEEIRKAVHAGLEDIALGRVSRLDVKAFLEECEREDALGSKSP